MRPLLKYGVPAAAGLATGGYALSQGEDPGSAALAAGAGALGGRAGLSGARLAGKYAPQLLSQVQDTALIPLAERMEKVSERIPRKSTVRSGLMQAAMGPVEGIANVVLNPSQERMVGKVAAAGLVPASAAAAGLGGIAAGAIPGALGVPGFVQQPALDPESYGSSNSMGARYKASTMQYV